MGWMLFLFGLFTLLGLLGPRVRPNQYIYAALATAVTLGYAGLQLHAI